jgi:hypothetical protein
VPGVPVENPQRRTPAENTAYRTRIERGPHRLHAHGVVAMRDGTQRCRSIGVPAALGLSIPTAKDPDPSSSWPAIVIEGTAGFEAAKIAAIALHTAPRLTREEGRRCAAVDPCPAVHIRCSGPPVSLFSAPGNRLDGPANLWPQWLNPTETRAGRK